MSDLAVSWSDLCGLDHGEVVDPAESGSHRRSESRRAEAHPAGESLPQVIETTRCHQRLNLSPSPRVLEEEGRKPTNSPADEPFRPV